MAFPKLALATVAFDLLATPLLAQNTQAAGLFLQTSGVFPQHGHASGSVATAPDDLGRVDGTKVGFVAPPQQGINAKVEVLNSDILRAGVAAAGETAPPDSATLLIPGHAGGGWDTTTRAIGQALVSSGALRAVTFENMGGENGALGLAHMIEHADALSGTLMLNSTQIVIRSLNGTYDASYADLVPVAAPVGDFMAFVVHRGSAIRSMADLMDAAARDGREFALGGGSAPGGIDHLAGVMARTAGGLDSSFNYTQFDAPGPALAALVAGDIMALTTDFTRAYAFARQGAVRIIGVTAGSAEHLPAGMATLKDQGLDVELVTWSGFFAPPNTKPGEVSAFDGVFADLYASEEWRAAVTANDWHALEYDSAAFADLLARQSQDIAEAIRHLEAAQ